MPYDLASAITSLTSSGAAIRALVDGMTAADARWKPAVDRWSVLEVINHLVDEEVEDFRARLDIIMHHPGKDFAPIDPPGAVIARRYAERDFDESVQRFARERETSLEWLQSLPSADLDRTATHQSMGTISGRQMLASWVAHDLHHVRQITRLRYERLERKVSPISLVYAGEW